MAFTDSKYASSILERLQGLPLALTQTGSYLRETNISLSHFIEDYDSTWADLMQEQHKFPIQEYSERTIWTTWKMSYEQVAKQSQDAAYLLKLWSLLDLGDLWHELIAPALQLPRLGIEVPSWLHRIVENRVKFSSALRILSRHSLVDSKEDTNSHSMHRVLHKWCYWLFIDSERTELSRIALGAVASLVPHEPDPQYWILQRRLLPHCVEIYRWAFADVSVHQAQISNSLQGLIFYRLGSVFLSQDNLDQAQEMYQRALHGREKELGAEHTSTLAMVNSLGLLYKDQGKLDKAEKMYQRALQGFEKTLGAEHTSTLIAVNNLGDLYRD